MRMTDIYKLAIKLLKKQAAENPGKTFTNSAGEKVSIKQVAEELNKVTQWMYEELRTEDIEKVVRCKYCKHYKKYKKKGALKTVAFYACSKDMQKRAPMFFCKDGDES